jgi:hypothetical protein
MQPAAPAEDPVYPAHELHGIVGTDMRQAFDMRDVIARIVDGSRFREFKKEYGTSIVTVSLRILLSRPHILIVPFVRVLQTFMATPSALSQTTASSSLSRP